MTRIRTSDDCRHAELQDLDEALEKKEIDFPEYLRKRGLIESAYDAMRLRPYITGGQDERQ